MRTLIQVRDYINTRPELDLVATVEKSWSSTDRKLGRNLRHPGRGRDGNRLRVYFRDELVHETDTSQTYRNVGEARDWLQSWESGNRFNSCTWGFPKPTGKRR